MAPADARARGRPHAREPLSQGRDGPRRSVVANNATAAGQRTFVCLWYATDGSRSLHRGLASEVGKRVALTASGASSAKTPTMNTPTMNTPTMDTTPGRRPPLARTPPTPSRASEEIGPAGPASRAPRPPAPSRAEVEAASSARAHPLDRRAVDPPPPDRVAIFFSNPVQIPSRIRSPPPLRGGRVLGPRGLRKKKKKKRPGSPRAPAWGGGGGRAEGQALPTCFPAPARAPYDGA